MFYIKMDTTIDLFPYFNLGDVKIYIIDRFLFVEIEQKIGLKGHNFTTFKYKHCRRLLRSVDIVRLKAFQDGKLVRFTVNDGKQADEIELTIDKARAWKKQPEKPAKFYVTIQEKYERFIIALKEINML